MQKLTFEKQAVLGVMMLGMGHLLWYLTDEGYFVNLGFLFYGILFLIHPVAPVSLRSNPKSKVYVRLAALIILLLGLTMRNGNGEDIWSRTVSDGTGIETKGAAVVSSVDRHSGLHGDGTTFVVLDLSHNPMKSCPEGEGWHELPLTETMQTLIYGRVTQNGRQGPYLDVSMPQVTHGYWFFYDRQGETFQDDQVMKQPSFNYTFAVYDEQTHQLHYCEFDT